MTLLLSRISKFLNYLIEMVVFSAIYYQATVPLLSHWHESVCAADTLITQLYTAKGVNKLIWID